MIPKEHDANGNGLHDDKEKKFMNPDSDPYQHKDKSLDYGRRAGLTHGLGIFLLFLGAWWLLGDLKLLPDVSLGALVALIAGIWLLVRSRRKKK